MLAFSSKPSEAQKQYGVLGTQLDQALDTTPGYPTSEGNEGEKYATARHLARQTLALQHAGYQRDVTKASDLLPLREADYNVTPGPYDTLSQRQARLLALRSLPQGATQANIGGALSALLGSGFIKLRRVAASEALSSLPTSNFQPAGKVPKFLALSYPIAVTGPQWVTYQNLDSTIPNAILLNLGDVVTVGGENNWQAEVVTVTGLRTTSAGLNQFQATFTNSHDAGATVTTMNFPQWLSTQAFLYVEVTSAVATNPVLRQQIDTLMAKLVRGVVQWATVTVNGSYLTQFLIGTTPLGTGVVGTVTP